MYITFCNTSPNPAWVYSNNYLLARKVYWLKFLVYIFKINLFSSFGFCEATKKPFSALIKCIYSKLSFGKTTLGFIRKGFVWAFRESIVVNNSKTEIAFMVIVSLLI
jgi:hypothetical protein